MTSQTPATSPLEGLAARVAGKLRGELAERQATLGDVAALTGLSRPTLSRRLRGSSAFDLDELERVCGAFDIDVLELLTRAAADHTPGRMEMSRERRRQLGVMVT